MLIENYRGKTRVLLDTRHHLVDQLRDEDSSAYRWLMERCESRVSLGKPRSTAGDARIFYAIDFSSELDATLFRLTFQKPGDLTSRDGEGIRIADSLLGYRTETVGKHSLAMLKLVTDESRDHMVFDTNPTVYTFRSKRGVAYSYCHAVQRNIHGYFVAWRVGASTTKRVSKTKRIVVAWARKKALA